MSNVLPKLNATPRTTTDTFTKQELIMSSCKEEKILLLAVKQKTALKQ